ncbi:MAG TPA: DUF1571 domain-containing protein [Burkholderiales bacterium]|nr:DUF1571 domain-containing protein [Burkholderiales bacterium]
MTRIICSALPFFFWVVSATADAAASSDARQWIEEAQAAYGAIESYTAIVHKQQRVERKLLPEETIFLKFRKPYSIYMKWIRPPYKGSELLFVEGWNENRVRAHRGGLLRFFIRDLHPTDPALMKGNLRPVTDMGIGQLITTVAMNVHTLLEAGELGYHEGGKEVVYGRQTRVVEFVLPRDPAVRYGGHRIVINQDVENRMLIRIRIYDHDKHLVENYGYEQLDLDARLTAADFDPANSAYRF